MMNRKWSGFVAVALAIVAAGCGDTTPPEDSVPVVETPAAPAPEPAIDSAAIADSIAQAQADSIAAAEAAAAAAQQAANQGGSNSGSAGGTTIWSGVYTNAEAAYGKELYDEVCYMCHTLDQWQDPGILTRHGSTLGGLFAFISDQMPQSEPGSLYAEDYTAIIAYMLSLNGLPTGNTELPTTYQGLDRIRITQNP